MSKPRKPYTCQTCNTPGHNRQTCPQLPRRQSTSDSAKAAYWLRANPNNALRDAAARFGISHQAVQQAWSALGFGPTPQRNRSAERHARILDLARSGKTAGEIAETVGLAGPAQIYRMCRLAGVDLKSAIGIDESKLRAAIEYVQNGGRIAGGAQMVGVTYGHFQRLLRERGVYVGPRVPCAGMRNGLGKAGSDLMDSDGLTLTAAATRVGVSPASIRSYRLIRGLPLSQRST